MLCIVCGKKKTKEQKKEAKNNKNGEDWCFNSLLMSLSFSCRSEVERQLKHCYVFSNLLICDILYAAFSVLL